LKVANATHVWPRAASSKKLFWKKILLFLFSYEE
jgi:hypothetical protein